MSNQENEYNSLKAEGLSRLNLHYQIFLGIMTLTVTFFGFIFEGKLTNITLILLFPVLIFILWCLHEANDEVRTQIHNYIKETYESGGSSIRWEKQYSGKKDNSIIKLFGSLTFLSIIIIITTIYIGLTSSRSDLVHYTMIMIDTTMAIYLIHHKFCK